jgi:predicted ArsR family transcriptional regulator
MSTATTSLGNAGADAVGEFARERSAELEARYAAQLATAGEDVTARAQALATALSADGFAASTRPVAAGHAPGRCAAAPRALPGSARRSPVPGVL